MIFVELQLEILVIWVTKFISGKATEANTYKNRLLKCTSNSQVLDINETTIKLNNQWTTDGCFDVLKFQNFTLKCFQINFNVKSALTLNKPILNPTSWKPLNCNFNYFIINLDNKSLPYIVHTEHSHSIEPTTFFYIV